MNKLSHNYSAYVLIDVMIVYTINLYLYRLSIFLLLATHMRVEVVWACNQRRGTLCRKEGDGNESSGEKEERKT